MHVSYSCTTAIYPVAQINSEICQQKNNCILFKQNDDIEIY